MLLLLFIFTGCTDKEKLDNNQANVSPSSLIEGNKKSINVKYELWKQDNYEIINGTKVLLVQIGENFTGEGILSVLIEKEDLNKKEFKNCVVEWSQS